MCKDYEEIIEETRVWLRNKIGDDEEVISEKLDDLVHDLASSLASTINNGGLDEQLLFIAEQCGDLAMKTIQEEFTGS